MRNYDRELGDAKAAATRALCAVVSGKNPDAVDHMATALDDLNKAWDALTDCLVRQREERDEQICRLIDELAEAKKGRP